MKIAVIGATGLIGRQTVSALRASGHEVVAVSRSASIDIITRAGLVEAMEGVEALIDASNVVTQESREAIDFFVAGTTNLIAAARELRHYVLLSIIGVDRTKKYGYFDGKRAQEQALATSGVPFTIVRAGQFFEFIETMIEWSTRDGVAYLPPSLMQPLDSNDVAEYLARTAPSTPLNAMVEIAGPERVDLVDAARRALTARGRTLAISPSWSESIYDLEMSGEVLLPNPGAVLTEGTFDDWLADDPTPVKPRPND